MFKLNIDGAVPGDIGRGGIGGIVPNHKGQWILGFAQGIYYTTPIEAELRALLRGLQMAHNHNFSPLEVSTYSMDVINILNKGHKRYDNIVCECKYLLRLLEPMELKHVFREQNRVADTLAKEGAKLIDPGNTLFFVNVPMHVKPLFDADAAGQSYVRKTSTIFLSYVC